MAPKHNETRGAADVSATANKKRELALPLSLMTLLLEESYKGYCLGYYKGYSAEDEHCLFVIFLTKNKMSDLCVFQDQTNLN